MTVVDAVVLAVLLIGLALGLLRGFLVQFTGLAGVVAGFWLALRSHEWVGEHWVHQMLETEHAAEIAFIGIVVVSVLVVALVGLLVRKVVEKLELGAYDRLLGGLFGFLKTGLLVAAILLGAVWFFPSESPITRSIAGSKAGPLIWKGLGRAARALPEEYRTTVRQFLQDHPLPSREAVREETGTPE